MLNFLSENGPPVLAVVLLFSFLLLLSAQMRVPEAGAELQGIMLAVVSPVVRVSATLVDSVRGVWQKYLNLRSFQARARLLEEEIGQLRRERQGLREMQRENHRLHMLLDLRESLPGQALSARVIGLELSGPFRVALLNRGARDGVQRDHVVLVPAGVVGRVTAVSGRLCKVQLITDPSSGVAAMVERTRVQGMVVGRGVNDLKMQYVSNLSDIQSGDAIITSGLDRIYPKGLSIGEVKLVRSTEGLQQRVVVQTAVDFQTLEEVLVVGGTFDAPPGDLSAQRLDQAPEGRP
ncbi:MAG: rod shape-determining protein MreC [Acidobacteriota bacterium]